MSLTIDDIEDAKMQGQALAMEFMQEIQAEIFEPVGKRMVREMMRTMSPMQKFVLKERAPEEYDEVMNMIGGK